MSRTFEDDGCILEHVELEVSVYEYRVSKKSAMEIMDLEGTHL